MEPQFEGEIKIEHLQGYLYVQQLIENTATANPGSMKEYSIDFIGTEIESEDLRKVAASLILNKMQYAIQRNESNLKFIEEYVEFEFLNNWESELREELNNWFADKYLSGINLLNLWKSYSEKQSDWSEEQKLEYIEKGNISTQKADKRLKEWKSNTKCFVDLLKGLINLQEIKVLKIIVPPKSEPRTVNNEIIHNLNVYWGMQFNLFIIADKDKRLFLHLGNILT